MRIAACLSGQSRTAAYCAPYLQRFFRGHQVDYFIHAWPDDVSHLPLYRPKSVSTALPPDLAAKERKIIETFGDYSFISRIPMYWGMSQAIRLVPENSYDLILRVRPDIVPLQRLNFTLSTFEPGSVCFAYDMRQPVRAWQPPSSLFSVADRSLAGYHDGLFFGTPDVMRHFEACYDLIDAFCDAGLGLHFRPAVYLHFLIATGITHPVRAPIAFHLIDEQHAQKSLSLYEFRDRQENRRAVDRHIAQAHSMATHLLGMAPVPLTMAEDFFESAWSDDASNSPGPSASARRQASRRYQRAV